MHTDETKDKGEKAKATDSGFAPMGQRMFEMMGKCCTSQGGFPDCSTMMKGMMQAMGNQPCKPSTKDTESDGSKK